MGWGWWDSEHGDLTLHRPQGSKTQPGLILVGSVDADFDSLHGDEAVPGIQNSCGRLDGVGLVPCQAPLPLAVIGP